MRPFGFGLQKGLRNRLCVGISHRSAPDSPFVDMEMSEKVKYVQTRGLERPPRPGTTFIAGCAPSDQSVCSIL